MIMIQIQNQSKFRVRCRVGLKSLKIRVSGRFILILVYSHKPSIRLISLIFLLSSIHFHLQFGLASCYIIFLVGLTKEVVGNMAQLAKQAEFDHIVKELLEAGNDWNEAVQEALETFQESNYDLSALYLYTSKLEFEEKEKAEKRCRTVEDVVQGKDSVVNLTFALQGLTQTIRCNNNNTKGTLLLTENRKLPLNLIRILANLCKEDEDDMDASNGEDSDEEDEEENLVMQKDGILEFLLFYINQDASSFRNYQDMLLLDETLAQSVLRIIDGSCDHAK